MNNPTNSVTLPTYPRPTLVRLAISGLTTATYLPNGDQSTFDARGRWAGGVYQACYEGVAISFAAGGVIPFGDCGDDFGPPPAIDPLTQYAIVQGQGTAFWTGGRPHASDECDFGPCRSYEGDKQIVVEPVWVDYSATASPTTVPFRDTVTITLTVTPSQVGGVNVPFSIDSAKWVPAFGTQVAPCQWSDFVVVDPETRRCRKPFTRSGTYSVFATVNGTQQQESFAITVEPPELDVTAAPGSIQGPDSVTFTATVTPSSITWNLSSWTWQPDSGTGGLSGVCNWWEKTCKRVISRSGWMKGSTTIGEYSLVDSVHVTVTPPDFQVTATPASIAGPQSVTFAATLNPEPPTAWNLSTWTWRPDSGTGGISAVCNWWEKSCARSCSKSGWMKATATIGAYALADSVHISVVPCLVGDSLLDDSRFRKLLNEAMNGSNPNASPWNRVERGGIRMLMPDGSVRDTLLPIGSTDNPCGMTFPDPATLPGTPILYWHTHPFRPNPTDPYPYDPTQTPRSNCPRLANAPPLPPGMVYYQPPGPSRTDSTSGLVPHAIVDKENVWLMTRPDGPAGPLDVKHYPRLGAGVCDPLAT